MISNLPDDVFVHILSFLPLKTSVSTSILSRRWLHLWKYTTKLILTISIPTDNVNWVNSALKSHRAPSLQEFMVDFLITEWNLYEVAKWIDFAFSRRVENLCLNFQDWWYRPNYNAPHLQKIIKLLSSGSMRSLKVLRLLKTKTDCDCIRFFLENCPLLEELVIRRARISLYHVPSLIGSNEDQVVCGPAASVFRHSFLKRFKLLWLCQDSIELVRYVVERCVGLEEIEFSWCEDTSKKRVLRIVTTEEQTRFENTTVRMATTEERTRFENTTQLQLPAHVKLRIASRSYFFDQPIVNNIT